MEQKFSRTYTVTTNHEEQLNVLEKLFETIEYLGNIGASRECKLYIDGDGQVDLRFICEKEKVKSNEVYGYGTVKISDNYRDMYFDLG